MRQRNGWDTALDAQVDLMASFATLDGRAYLAGVIDRLAEAGVIDTRTGLQAVSDIEADRSEFASRLVGACTSQLQTCDPFYVNEELTQLIGFAATHKSFKPEPLIPSDLIVPNGFAYFDAPLMLLSARGTELPFRALEWCRGREHDPQGDSWCLIALYQDHRDPNPNLDGAEEIGGSHLRLAYTTVLRFGQDTAAYRGDTTVFDMFAHIKVFFRMCQQTIAVPRFERVSRPVWKRAVKRWKPIKEVVVFTLRRAKPPRYEGPEREVHWSHRWFVGAHWRNQYYPSEKVHRQIWVAPYLKGPDDKPIIYKRRAFELVR